MSSLFSFDTELLTQFSSVLTILYTIVRVADSYAEVRLKELQRNDSHK